MQLNKQIKNTLRQKKKTKKPKKKKTTTTTTTTTTKKTRRRSRLVINPLITMNDQNRISPHIIFTTSSTQVMRKKINID